MKPFLLSAVSFPRQYFDKLRIGAKKDAASIRAMAGCKIDNHLKMEITIDKQFVLKALKPIAPDTHKGTQGHVLVIGGSYGKMGAICLAAKAALRAGSGLVTAFVPQCGYNIVQTAIPEAMALTDRDPHFITKIAFDIQPQAIGIGPGMGQEPQTQKALHDFLQDNTAPLVLDADALNILSRHKDWLGLLAPDSVLTPHPKELEQLIGSWQSEHQKIEMAGTFSKTHNLILVIKGAPTIVISGDAVYRNSTGNAALATAGSGDVLTGIVTSLIGQGHSTINAAVIGVYLHGLTADIALPQTGVRSFIASDIIAYLGKAFLELENRLI